MHKYEVIQSDLSTQQFGHVDFVCVQGAEQDLKVDNNVTSGMKLANRHCYSPNSSKLKCAAHQQRQAAGLIHTRAVLSLPLPAVSRGKIM